MRNFRPVTAFAILALSSASSAATITVTDERLQEIKGWGVFGGYHRLSDWGTDFSLVSRSDFPGSVDKTNILDALWKDLGVSMARVDLPPTYYDPEAPDKINAYRIMDLVKHLEAANKRGVTEYKIAVWSPPASMKQPARSEGKFWRRISDGANKAQWFAGIDKDPAFENVTTALREDKEAEFVTYYAKAVKHLTTHGLPAPVAISLQNEPRWNPDYDACVYSAPQYHRVAIALRAALDAEGLTSVKLIGPEHNDYGDGLHGNPIFYKNWSALGKIDGKPNALATAFAGTASHSYDLSKGDDWDKKAYLNEYSSALERLQSDFPEWDFWATEHSIDYPNDMDEMGLTMTAIRQFNREIATLPHNYWFWWQGYNLTDPANHLQALLTGTDSDLKKSKLYHIFSKLWNAAPVGSIVRKVTSDHPSIVAAEAFEIDTVAFERTDGRIVLLVCNPTSSAQTVTLNGFRGTSSKVFLTTAGEDMLPQADLVLTDGGASYEFPAGSIVLFVNGNADAD